MLPAKISHGFMEIRRDLQACDQGRLRGGILIFLATMVVVGSGWPPGDGIQRGIFFVLGALPLAGLGAGLSIGEVMHARADRRGQDDADDREFEVLRARIAIETGRVVEADTGSSERDRPVRAERPRPLMQNLGPLVTRKRSSAGFRSGHLRLR